MKGYPPSVIARHQLIMELLANEGRVEVVDVATRLEVAQETVRRDLRALEAAGSLQRVHGGAISVTDPPLTLGVASETVSRAEQFLAARLLRMLPRTGTILMGAGRLTLAVAQALTAAGRERNDLDGSSAGPSSSAAGLTVVTNSLDVAITLARVGWLTVYNVGGTVSGATRAQEGDWALEELRRLHVDLSLVCPAGVSATQGLSQPTPAAAAISQAEVACAQQVFALADANGLGRAAFFRFAGIEDVDRLIVSGQPELSVLRPFLDRGLPVDTQGKE